MQDKEFNLMKSYYPGTVQHIQEKIEEECDLMDYEGSRLYDEYPDRFSLRMMCNRIFDKVVSQEKLEPEDWLRNLIEVILYQELFKRRSDDRRNRRRFY